MAAEPAPPATLAPALPAARRPGGRAGTLLPSRPPVLLGGGPWPLLVPAVTLLALFMAVPALWLVRLSLFESGSTGNGAARFFVPGTFTWEHYRQALADRYFRAVAWSTLKLCLLTAGICLLLGYPLAVWIDRAGRRARAVATWAVALPKLVNALVLLYGVLLLLGNAGLVNSALLRLGVIHAPLPMFANLLAVLAGEVLLVLPYPVLMLLGVLRATERGLEEAAWGLGATPARAFLETTFQLTLPGAAVACLVTLVWGAGAFVSPLVLGNPSLYTASVEVHRQTFERVNWPLAATVAILQVASIGLLALGGLALQRLVAAGRRRPQPASVAPPGSRHDAVSSRAAGVLPARPTWAVDMWPARRVAPRPPLVAGWTPNRAVDVPPARRVWPAGHVHGDGHAATHVTPPAIRPPRAWPAAALDRLGALGYHGLAVATLLFLAVPLCFSLAVSLAPGQVIALPSFQTGVSLRWYGALLGDPLWLAALWHSLLAAGVACAIAVPAGALAAIAVEHVPPRHGRLLTLCLIWPLFVPGVVLGLQDLALFYQLGLWGKPYSVGLAHAAWTMPLAFLVVRAALAVVDRRLEEAAQGLGAHPVVAFCLITLPRLWPAIGAATFLCAIMSLNELPMALFLATPATRTLPTLIWPQLRYNLTPLVAAASGVLLLATAGGLAGATAITRTLGRGHPTTT